MGTGADERRAHAKRALYDRAQLWDGRSWGRVRSRKNGDEQLQGPDRTGHIHQRAHELVREGDAEWVRQQNYGNQIARPNRTPVTKRTGLQWESGVRSPESGVKEPERRRWTATAFLRSTFSWSPCCGGGRGGRDRTLSILHCTRSFRAKCECRPSVARWGQRPTDGSDVGNSSRGIGCKA
jgi:hypothetical protein